MRPLKGWWTVAFNALIAGLASIQAGDLATVVPDQYLPLALAVFAAINVGLRTLTTTPVGKPVLPLPNEAIYDPNRTNS